MKLPVSAVAGDAGFRHWFNPSIARHPNGLVRDSQGFSEQASSGRPAALMICERPMNLRATSRPALWGSGPAWLAQASSMIHGVRFRSVSYTHLTLPTKRIV